MIDFTGNKLAFVHVMIFVLYESFCPYFEKYVHTSILPTDFRTNTVKYRRVGRSANVWMDWPVSQTQLIT